MMQTLGTFEHVLSSCVRVCCMALSHETSKGILHGQCNLHRTHHYLPGTLTCAPMSAYSDCFLFDNGLLGSEGLGFRI